MLDYQIINLSSLFSRMFAKYHSFVCLTHDSCAQQGYVMVLYPIHPCHHHRLGCTLSLSLAGCSVTASTTPAAGPAIAAALASTSSPGSLPLLTAPTSAAVSWSWLLPSFSSFPKQRVTPCHQPLDVAVQQSLLLKWWVCGVCGSG